jgi:AraC family transcriptional regulator
MRSISSRRSSVEPAAPRVITREVNGFLFQESRYQPGYGGGVHRHDTAYLGYVVSGDFTETCPRGRSRYAGGSLHFHPAGDPHSGVVGEQGARSFNILPARPLAARLDDAAGTLGHGEWPRHVASLAGRCHRAFLARDAASDLECEAAALELLAAVLRMGTPRETGTPSWLFAARDYLHAHPSRPITLFELSQVAGVHAVHLVRVFRRRLGVTPAEYARQLRLEFACRALAETDQPIVEVALEAGYSSQAHMTAAFRTQLGSTPAAYRRARRSRV